MSSEGLRLSLPATPENVALVRHALAGLAETLGMHEGGVADLKTVVSEACMNAVVHAYDEGGPGLLEVTATPDSSSLTVTVRDFGSGFRPQADLEGKSMHLGLPLIAALSSNFAIRGSRGEGTVVEMRMALSPNGYQPDSEGQRDIVAPPPGAEISVSSPEMMGPVVSRVLSVIAARSDFGVDRLADAVLLGDAISAHASGGFADGRVHLMIEDGEGGLVMRLGPMMSGAAERIRGELKLPELGASIERLASEVSVETASEGEYLALRIAA